MIEAYAYGTGVSRYSLLQAWKGGQPVALLLAPVPVAAT